MKKMSVSAVFFFLALLIYGQNLVPNCDLSLVQSCPDNTNQLNRSLHWYKPGEGTSDLCHTCSGGSVGIPYNMWGQEEPVSGEGYIHLICYEILQGNDYREYAQVKLVCGLIAGEKYNVSFYVSVSDISRYVIDGLGLLFSQEPITQSGDNVIDPGFPGHIYNPPGVLITNSDGWKMISGQYTAAGGEEYITIGNFLPNDQLTIDDFITQTNLRSASIYVDMVSVTPVVPYDFLTGDTTLCYGESLMLTTPDICTGTYTWDDGSTGSVRLITQPGTYSLTVNLGCSVIHEEMVLSWLPKPQLDMPRDTVLCSGSSILMAPGDFTSYLWQDGSQGESYLADEAGTYWVEITDDLGCSFRDTVLIGSLEPPEVSLSDDMVLCFGDSLLLDAGNDDLYTTYLWQDNTTLPYLTVMQEGLYSVVATNPCGSDMDDILVGFRNCNPVVTVPNAFTPNGDGRNDTFRAKGINISNYRMQVFNRWGELIFSSFDPGHGWDGKKNGEDCASDVYVWSVYYESDALDQPVRETVKGTVMLIR
jgi:gliding motility-associated-like protein